jgi:serine/threonine protein phosphatase PrpC
MTAEHGPEEVLAAWLRSQPRGLNVVDELACVGTRPGTERDANEDRVLMAQFVGMRSRVAELFVICDGMGGMAEGAVCAELAIASFTVTVARLLREGRTIPRILHEATQRANQRVHALFGGKGGTTLAAILVHSGLVSACCVGDSRILLVTADGKVRQLSRDDTVKGALEAMGQRAVEAMPEHERLVQFLGMGPDLEPQVFSIADARHGRFVVLATDGVYRLPGDVVGNVAKLAHGSKQLCERLLHIADWFGGADDASVVAVSRGLFSRELPVASDDHHLLRLWGPSGQLAIWIPPIGGAMERRAARDADTPLTSAQLDDSARGKGRRKSRTKRDREQLHLAGTDELVISIGSAESKRVGPATERDAAEDEEKVTPSRTQDG